MRYLILFSLIVYSVLGVSSTKSKPNKLVNKKQLETMGAKLGTDFKFTGLDVAGRYRTADVGLAVVEDDKPINELLDYDQDFLERSRNQRGLK